MRSGRARKGGEHGRSGILEPFDDAAGNVAALDAGRTWDDLDGRESEKRLKRKRTKAYLVALGLASDAGSTCSAAGNFVSRDPPIGGTS